MKPFYRSRKFLIALGTSLAMFVISILPQIVNLEPSTVDMLHSLLPKIFVVGLLWMGGHITTDMVWAIVEGRLPVPTEVVDEKSSNSTDNSSN